MNRQTIRVVVRCSISVVAMFASPERAAFFATPALN